MGSSGWLASYAKGPPERSPLTSLTVKGKGFYALEGDKNGHYFAAEGVRYQFHSHAAVGETAMALLNSGNVKTNKAVDPGVTVVGRDELSSGL